MRAAMITRYQQPLEIVNLADPKLPKDGCCQTNENSRRIASAA